MESYLASTILEFISDNLWAVKFFGIIFLTFVFATGERKIFQRVYPKFQASRRIWDNPLAYAIHLPLNLYIWLSGITLSIWVSGSGFQEDPYILSTIEKGYKIGGLALFVWALFRLIHELERNFISLKKMGQHDPTTVRGGIQGIKVFVFITASIAFLQTLGIPLSGVIAFGGIGGIAVGFAAKDLLANFFGGLMIFLDRPFQIGDWVRSPDKEIEGTVEHIGWRHTRIRTFDKRPLFVPNSLFSTISLENPSRMSNRRIKTTFGLSYEDSQKVAPLLKEIEKMVRNHPDIDSSNTCFVNLIDFGPYSLEIQVYAFTKTTDWIEFQAVQQDVFLKILEVVHSFGSELAYPATALHFSKSTKPFGEKLFADRK